VVPLELENKALVQSKHSLIHETCNDLDQKRKEQRGRDETQARDTFLHSMIPYLEDTYTRIAAGILENRR
jgi:hypothetical protein